LFVGRFIPDKGLHYFNTGIYRFKICQKKLVFDWRIAKPVTLRKNNCFDMASDKIIFPGYVYGSDVNTLMSNAYCYIQPSDVGGIVAGSVNGYGLNVPLIVSDIKETNTPFKIQRASLKRAILSR